MIYDWQQLGIRTPVFCGAAEKAAALATREAMMENFILFF
jgi:hypothetical protein